MTQPRLRKGSPCFLRPILHLVKGAMGKGRHRFTVASPWMGCHTHDGMLAPWRFWSQETIPTEDGAKG